MIISLDCLKLVFRPRKTRENIESVTFRVTFRVTGVSIDMHDINVATTNLFENVRLLKEWIKNNLM